MPCWWIVRYHGLAAAHRYRFCVTCVGMPGRLQDARDVLRFCVDRGISYSVLPRSKGPYPDPDLTQDPGYPTLAPRIMPNGDLCYPCSPLGTIAGSLLGARSFAEVLADGIARHGPIPPCDARCFASCYIETSACISAPLSMVREYLTARRPSATR